MCGTEALFYTLFGGKDSAATIKLSIINIIIYWVLSMAEHSTRKISYLV